MTAVGILLTGSDRVIADHDRPMSGSSCSSTCRRVWTKPYTFFSSHQTGITCADPVFEPGPEGALPVVLTVNFDVNALSRSIASTPLEDAKTLLFASDGTRLGHSARPPRYLAVGPVLSGESAFYLPDKIEIGDRPLGDSASSALDGDSRPLRSIQHCVAVRGHWRRPPQPTDRRLQSNRSCHPPGRIRPFAPVQRCSFTNT
jgi:hypothetical protein